jgi:CHAD domain-containing protein
MIKAEVDINQSVIGSIDREIVSVVELKKNNPNETEMLVHEFRKSIKRIRAILRLIKPSLQLKTFFDLDSELSQIAKSIAEVRDTAVNLQSLLKLDSISHEKLPKEIRYRAINELSKQYKLAFANSETGMASELDNVMFRLQSFMNRLEKATIKQTTSDQLFVTLSKSYYKSLSSTDLSV